MEGAHYTNTTLKKASVTWHCEEKEEWTQELAGEHQVLLCKLGLWSRNQ